MKDVTKRYGRRRFYGEMMGRSKIVSRTGSALSGMWAHIRGWDIGINVRLYVNEDGDDEVTVHLTGGSNNPTPSELIFTDSNGEDVFVTLRAESPLRIRIKKSKPVSISIPETNIEIGEQHD